MDGFHPRIIFLFGSHFVGAAITRHRLPIRCNVGERQQQKQKQKVEESGHHPSWKLLIMKVLARLFVARVHPPLSFSSRLADLR
jgi:hypothetical protein